MPVSLVLAQNLLGHTHKVVQAAGTLHGGGGGYYGGYHEHDVDRRRPGFQPEDKHQYGDADAAHHPESDAPEARADDYCRKNKQQLYYHNL